MTDSPRVFYLITRLLNGGAEDHVLTCVRGLADEYEIVVGHGASYDPDQVRRLQEAGVETRRFPLLRHYNPVTAVPAVFTVARYARQADVDLVHTNSTEAGIVGRFAASLADVPVVHTVHGVPFTEDRNRLLNRFVGFCERRAAPRTDVITANADAMVDDYLSRGIGTPDQYETVYSGIDVEAFRDADPAQDLPGADDQTRILMVSRLVRGKGIGDLLAAVERLDRDDVSVLVAGDGPLSESLPDEIERRGLADAVHLLGYRNDVPALMNACDLLVLPSYREGTPRVITEAMASGLPVVSTAIAGIPEQVDDGRTGYLVDPGDVPALADRLDELLDDPQLRAEMGEAGRRKAGAFSEAALVERTGEIYERVLDGVGSAAGR